MNHASDRRPQTRITRRHFFGRSATGIGVAALASLLSRDAACRAAGGLPGFPHFPPKAKRVIYLFQHGAPSQLDLFDYKPSSQKHARHGAAGFHPHGPAPHRHDGVPGEVSHRAVHLQVRAARRKRRLAERTAAAHRQSRRRPLRSSGRCTPRPINHDPAVTFFQTGFQLAGRPSIGSWISYGLGSENKDLPAFVVMVSQGVGNTQALADRMWGSGFLPTKYQGVKFRSGARSGAVPFESARLRCRARAAASWTISAKLNELNSTQVSGPGDRHPHRAVRDGVPDASLGAGADRSFEGARSTFEMYGPDSRKPGTYAANCILARRLAERGVRFIQLFHRGWDQHSNLPKEIARQCLQTDQPTAALIQDLKQRGMLDDTLVVWGGEFGRTVYSQGTLTRDELRPRPSSALLHRLDGGRRRQARHDLRRNRRLTATTWCKNPVDVHDLHATILHCLGVDHTKLTYKYQGAPFPA